MSLEKRSDKEALEINAKLIEINKMELPTSYTTNAKLLSLAAALVILKHEHRRIRRAGEEFWHELYDGKLVRTNGARGVRGISVEDAITEDWECENIYRSLSADEIRDAMLCAIRNARQGASHSPMELLHIALRELGLL